jgi:hypothetical protein
MDAVVVVVAPDEAASVYVSAHDDGACNVVRAGDVF